MITNSSILFTLRYNHVIININEVLWGQAIRPPRSGTPWALADNTQPTLMDEYGLSLYLFEEISPWLIVGNMETNRITHLWRRRALQETSDIINGKVYLTHILEKNGLLKSILAKKKSVELTYIFLIWSDCLHSSTLVSNFFKDNLS